MVSPNYSAKFSRFVCVCSVLFDSGFSVDPRIFLFFFCQNSQPSLGFPFAFSQVSLTQMHQCESELAHMSNQKYFVFMFLSVWYHAVRDVQKIQKLCHQQTIKIFRNSLGGGKPLFSVKAKHQLPASTHAFISPFSCYLLQEQAAGPQVFKSSLVCKLEVGDWNVKLHFYFNATGTSGI